MNEKREHFVYILKCADGTLYTGYTTDPERRLRVHNSGKGAKYTRSRLPVELVHLEKFDDKIKAQKREYAIKRLSREQKISLTTPETIKTIIFDIGNVLMSFDYWPFIKDFLKDDAIIDKVNNALWYSGLWNEMDRGEDPDVILNKMMATEPEAAAEIKLTFDNVGLCMHKKEYAIPWIKELKGRGYRVIYLSNYAEHTMEAKPDVLDFLPYMDGGVFSCYERLTKPEPEIFRLIEERYGLIPEECIFLDDSEPNVKAARSLGFNAIHFKDYESARLELEAIIGSRANANEGNTAND